MMREVTNKTLEWQKCGALYYAPLGYTEEGRKAYIYSKTQSLPMLGDVLIYDDALLLVNGKHRITLIEVEGRKITKCEGARCLWFGTNYTFDNSEFNRLLVILLSDTNTALIEVDNWDKYTIEVNLINGQVTEYPNLSIEAYHKAMEE
jgi:hypothetical protein